MSDTDSRDADLRIMLIPQYTIRHYDTSPLPKNRFTIVVENTVGEADIIER